LTREKTAGDFKFNKLFSQSLKRKPAWGHVFDNMKWWMLEMIILQIFENKTHLMVNSELPHTKLELI
jgi:hypothetical protein